MTSPIAADHLARFARATLALDGLSVGDALGGQFFIPANHPLLGDPNRPTPPPPWGTTDDTEMALTIWESLRDHGRIDQSQIASGFARRYSLDSYRGYGPAAHGILEAIGRGEPWRAVARSVFDGQGTMVNGAAMRVAPVGGYFADDFALCAAEAVRSAEVTHAHPEGVTGAAAVAGAWAWQHRDSTPRGDGLFDAVLDYTPDGATRRGIDEARQLGSDQSPESAAHALGNGSRVTAPDTVPFCLWVAARHPRDYPAAIWATVAGGGDVDTTCAIVGGIVALAAGRDGIPPEWVAAREPLRFDV